MSINNATDPRVPDGFEVFRDDSEPSFTADHPQGQHAAWKFRRVRDGRTFGPYMTRDHATVSARFFARMEEIE